MLQEEMDIAPKMLAWLKETGEARVECVSSGSSDQMQQHTNGSESSHKHERSGSDDIIESDVTKRKTPDNIWT